MDKESGESVFSVAGTMNELLRQDCDEVGDEIWSEESDDPEVDPEKEERVCEGEDIAPDNSSSDEDWQPETSAAGKRSHSVAFQGSSSEESDEESCPSPSQTSCSRRLRGRSTGRDRASSEPSSPSGLPEERWLDVSDPDITPAQPDFRPAHAPGPKLIPTATYTVLQLFQLFFTNSVVQTIVTNTNEYGRAYYKTASNPWTDITLQDMFSFMALVIYMGIVKCSAFTDYWRGDKLYNLPFPQNVMSRNKFKRINQSLHMSSSADDAANDQQQGTTTYDRLCKIKPLYEELRAACKQNYHPAQAITVDERMVKQCMRNKPLRWGYKLFVLADLKSGYTWDFFVYEGKQVSSEKGLGYESVTQLLDTTLLGTGYKLFVDDFYTSPALFRDLLQQKIWACGNICINRKVNGLTSKSTRGSIWWIRKNSLLFVQWRDTKDVFMCSTFHTAHGPDTVTRRVKGDDGQWTKKDVPVPPAVKEYNQHMRGVEISDSLITYYKVLHKTRKWYKTFFYYFLDIATVNAFILHKELAMGKGEKPLTQKAFRETLAEQLAQVGSAPPSTPAPPAPAPAPATSDTWHHKPVYIAGDSSKGRLKCRQCHSKTPVKCRSCNIPLCFVANRDCYNAWHDAEGL
ncbi:piggyBac transposable element-derived protein 4-like [Cheilinus undulatus]|uniref:piggyBac transposable element-derived protein 4-like n=1 Tax=Cheilinus undulatus TaxID=241271 RepID=UPI001BD5C9D8|nr:piggyBac transposable element-derived protein 4-like [Cheilinus undulatus]